MSGFIFGDVSATVTNPWAYDSTNDLPKTHPLYLQAAGLVSVLTINDQVVAASTLVTTNQAQFTVPAGKKGYVLDFWISCTGEFVAELDINSTGIITLHTGTFPSSLSDSLRLNAPLVVPATDTVGAIWKNNDTVSRAISLYLAVAIL